MPSPSPRAAAYTPPAQPDFFVQTPVSVVRCRTLTPVQKTTYDVLRSYADATGTAYLGQARLAAEVGCSERTVRDAVHHLAAAGLVAVRRRGQGRTNLYHLTRIPLRAPQSRADRQSLPVQDGRPRRPKAALIAAESDPLERDPAKQDQPPAREGGGETVAQIAADAALIATATGMAPDEAQATAQAAATTGHGPDYVAELVAHVTSSPSVQNPAGCLRALVQRGKRRPPRGAGGVPPRSQRHALHPEHYSPGGKYAHLFHRAGVVPTPDPQPPTPNRRGPSAFEVAANPKLAGHGKEAWPRGQPMTGP
jgi:biotin operon repressor